MPEHTATGTPAWFEYQITTKPHVIADLVPLMAEVLFCEPAGHIDGVAKITTPHSYAVTCPDCLTLAYLQAALWT